MKVLPWMATSTGAVPAATFATAAAAKVLNDCWVCRAVVSTGEAQFAATTTAAAAPICQP
eukprot:CAMPEP_0204003964 /NCGR_PEP_ID=MMETSP0360-20130528/18038_1 /ASSEMBLY_ACC=CAM_ASM_000342 /TAXON_ID=268821 /ORGANISM="Scrippsiella Hangoei, Strain SHTV-5" /LENGTH=59 /DNA_ID=CAMNT_0050945765 /DNA_START=64 /DNA_END=239 /DNA_ORIENTATION=-